MSPDRHDTVAGASSRSARFHLPRRTVRLRLTLLYSSLFLASGFLLLAITNVGARSDVVAVGPIKPLEPIRAPVGPFVDDHARWDRLAASSALALVVMFALSIVLGWWIAGRALRPLRTITTTARAISASNLHERLALDGPDDEFRELGDTLDDLFARLESSFDSQRHFVANASHELRTPLTAERTLLQVALADPEADVASLRAACQELLALGEQQERLIESLLTLASSEGGVVTWARLDLADVVRAVLASRAEEAARRGIAVESSLLAAEVSGDPALVDSLVSNLVDNGLLHNRAPGRIELSTTTSPDGRAVLTIRNTGPVVAPDRVPELFEPFTRHDDTRLHGSDGHGLGLAIVRAIADAHGAAVTARARPDGGLEIEVAFVAPR